MAGMKLDATATSVCAPRVQLYPLPGGGEALPGSTPSNNSIAGSVSVSS